MPEETESKTKTIEEVAEETGCSLAYLRSQPLWIQEGRAATCEEYSVWVRSQRGGCREYAALFPLASSRGKCFLFKLYHNKSCGIPGVDGVVCRTGVPKSSGEREVRVGWKDFRRNMDRLGRTPEGRMLAVQESLTNVAPERVRRTSRASTSTVTRTSVRGTIEYTCEVCRNSFGSKRRRTGPKICASCIGKLRAEGKGPQQLAKKGEIANGNGTTST